MSWKAPWNFSATAYTSVRLHVDSTTASERCSREVRSWSALGTWASPTVIRSSRSSGQVRWFNPRTMTDNGGSLLPGRGEPERRREHGSRLVESPVADEVKHPRIQCGSPIHLLSGTPGGPSRFPLLGEQVDERVVLRAELVLEPASQPRGQRGAVAARGHGDEQPA